MKKTLIIIGIIAALLLVIAYQGDKAIFRRAEKTVVSVDASQLRTHIVDSMRSDAASRLLAQKDSILTSAGLKALASETRLLGIRVENEYLSREADTLREYYRTHHDLPTCDSLLSISHKQIIGLNVEVDTLTALKNSYKLSDSIRQQKCEILAQSLTFKNADIDRANQNIALLQRQIRKDNSWWRRNNKWIFFAGGCVLTGLVLK